MKNKITVLLAIGLLWISVPAFAGPPSQAGVTRTSIEAWDNWGWQGRPQSDPRIICPGGDLTNTPIPCNDSKTGRVHVRGGAAWSCVTSNDPRMTGLGLFTSNVNFDAEANGPAWGEFKIVPIPECNKDADYSEEYEELAEYATRFWHGTWNGQRQYDMDLNAWISEIRMIGKGFGEDLEGLHFKGTEWITTFTALPLPYEYLFPYGSPEFDMPEAYMVGTIKE